MTEPVGTSVLLEVAKLRELTGRLRQGRPVDNKIIAEAALVAWLDTVAPESRAGALEAWIQRMRFRLEEGQ